MILTKQLLDEIQDLLGQHGNDIQFDPDASEESLIWRVSVMEDDHPRIFKLTLVEL